MHRGSSGNELKKAAKRALVYLNVNRRMMTLKSLYWSDNLYGLACRHIEQVAQGGGGPETPEALPHRAVLEVEVLDGASTNIAVDELMSKFLTQRADGGKGTAQLFDELHTHGAVALLRTERGVLMAVLLWQDATRKL